MLCRHLPINGSELCRSRMKLHFSCAASAAHFLFSGELSMKNKLLKSILLTCLIVCILAACCSAITDEPTTDSTTKSTTSQNSSSSISTNASTPSISAPTTTQSAHVHIFSAATCVLPKTCSCGVTEGTANGHSWKNATCTDPKTCRVCGTTSGLTAGHNFSNGKCTTCGKADPDYSQVTMVWIPTNGGTKYHTRPGCSNMENPEQVTKSEAESLGFSPCKRCH